MNATTPSLTHRQWGLVREALERLDPDTLNDDLPPGAETTGDELDAIARAISDALGDNLILGPCECGAQAAHLFYNGRDHLFQCDDCWADDETVILEAVLAFRANVASDEAHLGFGALNDCFDANSVLDEAIRIARSERGLPELDGEEWIAFVNRAAESHDEWYAAPSAT